MTEVFIYLYYFLFVCDLFYCCHYVLIACNQNNLRAIIVKTHAFYVLILYLKVHYYDFVI